MLKAKRIAGSITSAAVTTAILLGTVMPGVVLADEVTVLNEGFEGTNLVSSGWSTELYTDGYDWSWAIRTSEEISERSDGEVNAAYSGSKSAYINYCDAYLDYCSLLISPTMDLSSYTSASISFYYVIPQWSGENEKLSLWYRVDGGEWMPITAFTDGDDIHEEWTSSGKITLPDDVLVKNVEIGFRALEGDGYGIGLDNVVVKGEKITATEGDPEYDPFACMPEITGGKAHIQDIGDKTFYPDPETGIMTLGTTGQGRRIEQMTFNLSNPTGLSGTLQYRVHVQDIGWMDWVDAGKPAGTTGQGKRIEGIEMRLTGELAENYTIMYMVHIQDYGYAQGWVKDGTLAGTTGESKRIEEVSAFIIPKGYGDPVSVMYRVHVQDYGWESEYAADGEMSGTSGQSKRLEGIEIFIAGSTYSGGIKYKTHVQDYGWETSWSQDGEMSGTQGQSKRLEGISIELYGEIAIYYDVYYRVHAQDIGWLSWACNGDYAGTAGRSARLEGIQIVLVPKGCPVPAETYLGITSVSPMCFVEGFGDAVG